MVKHIGISFGVLAIISFFVGVGSTLAGAIISGTPYVPPFFERISLVSMATMIGSVIIGGVLLIVTLNKELGMLEEKPSSDWN